MGEEIPSLEMLMHKNAIKLEIFLVVGKYYRKKQEKEAENWRIFRDFRPKTWRIWQ